jgi:uncharacterized protein
LRHIKHSLAIVTTAGEGKARLQKAKYWYERAAADGQVAALFNLAVMNENGIGMRRNLSRAARLYEQAALRGDLQSQTNLTVMLLDGAGEEKGYSRWT